MNCIFVINLKKVIFQKRITSFGESFFGKKDYLLVQLFEFSKKWQKLTRRWFKKYRSWGKLSLYIIIFWFRKKWWKIWKWKISWWKRKNFCSVPPVMNLKNIVLRENCLFALSFFGSEKVMKNLEMEILFGAKKRNFFGAKKDGRIFCEESVNEAF